MAILKCKMCGGTLEMAAGESVAVCEYCGTKQTLAKTEDEVIINLFNRANNLRLKNEFDKAQEIYEKIVNTGCGDAEAYWGIVLCKYGIEYVEDPSTFKRIPTCHRTLLESVLSDIDYLAAVEHADDSQKLLYEQEAKEIDRLQKDILQIADCEKPFDVFICYKETNADGTRSVDSVIANDIYHHLTQEGFNVFYAAITLEDKLGQEYEPYIFAALNSAKVMLVVGTKPEHFEAVWVKNEWSRFLKIIKNDKSKLLIPCYKDMDAYDLPEEFSHLQAQDMGKIGFLQDLIRGIKKVLSSDAPQVFVSEPVAADGGVNAAPLLKRAFLFLEDKNWAEADEYCEKVLDRDPECAEAYLGKLMAELQVSLPEKLKDCDKPFDDRDNYRKAVRFADEKLKKTLAECIAHITTRNENASMEEIYIEAVEVMEDAYDEDSYQEAADLFDTILKYKDSAKLCEQCLANAEICRKDDIYACAEDWMSYNTIHYYKAAIKKFQTILGWKDASEQIEICRQKVEELRVDAEKREKIYKKIFLITTPIVCAIIAFVILLNMVIIPFSKYKKAEKLFDEGKYSEAYTAFNEINFKDSSAKAEEALFPVQKSTLSNIVVGDTIKFGFYEQDNDILNGKEEIEWIVLAVEENRALVISKKVLECMPYNTIRSVANWESCSLRGWLNDAFYNTAFSVQHRTLILPTNVPANENPEYNTNPGNATQDNIFLLSVAEVNQYFSSDSERQCDATAYTEDFSNGSWGLRSPGMSQTKAAIVNSSGYVSYSGTAVDMDRGVRPAMWINLGA